MVAIAVSADFIRPGQVGGAEQATMCLLDGLSSALRAGDRLLITGPEELASRLPSGAQLLRSRLLTGSRFAAETVNALRLSRSADAVWYPNYFTPWGSLPDCVVTTIHDLQYLHMPENFSDRKRHWLRAAHRRTLQRADAVVCLSEVVRADVALAYGSEWDGKLLTIPNAVCWSRFAQSEQSEQPSRPFILSVASHYRHKNLATLLRAFASMRRQGHEIDLVLVGQVAKNLVGVSRAEDVGALITELRIGDCVRATGYVPDVVVGQLYEQASLFVFPSLFEGFGLPPVEALGFGLPVITTRCGSLPEVTLGLADYVDDPTDEEELAALMLLRIEDGKRPDPSSVGELRSFYAPERIGRLMYDVLTRS